ncbi:MAG: bifunctional pyr operon transcriptional regulator/uracil phosphoribosyltransferase PyrR [Deltaproteobacteria bacterium]|jgi:pyrimidine operon attenuation protein/uracil phosphoribosyltransferase|nr:bifunctional pyr operon transcriptional regulator/uracil phosphoribosyltransferase PyrR [Deltaproteobacteria bacterium]
MAGSRSILKAGELDGILEDLAGAVLARHKDCAALAFIGIERRGVNIASDLIRRMEKHLGRALPLGSLDITLYRDDWTMRGPKPRVGRTRIPFAVEGLTLVLVDDVLFSGRTVRAALEALADHGRPGRIELLVLVDRGHRELPIHADYVGLSLDTEQEDRVDVLVREVDGEEGIRLVSGAPPQAA